MQRTMIAFVPAALSLWLVTGGALAQHQTNFESLTASAAGTSLHGQDGYYNPVTGSADHKVFTYAGNALGFSTNPNGGANFVGGTGPAGSPVVLLRSQRDFAYGNGKGTWTMGFDVAVKFAGTLPAADNIGSVSLQPSTTARFFIALARWQDPATALAWKADYQYFNAAGTAVTASVPNTAFQNLALDKWYRWETDFNLSTNQIVEIRLTDIAAATTVSHTPSGWYMNGGNGAVNPAPTAYRLFTGTSVAGNTMGFDNVKIETTGYSSTFETFTASAAGTAATGQDSFYNPVPASSVDFKAYTYAGNALNVPVNPGGGNNFVAAVGPGPVGTPPVLTFGRAQRDVSFGFAKGKWTLGYDVLAQFNGTLPTAQNLGSVSLQPSVGTPVPRYFISLATWVDVNTAALWNASFIYFSATNVQTQVVIPDPAFQNLPTNKWYRLEIDFDMTSNAITQLRITDIATTTTTKYNPTGWYLQGGPNATNPAPTGFRFFAGGSIAGNTLAFDNAVLLPDLASAPVYGCSNPVGSLKVVSGAPTVGQTTVLALDNPLATQANGSSTALFFAPSADPAYPCGTLLPGFGMAGSGANGEFLLNLAQLFPVVLAGPSWSAGTPAQVPITIPKLADFVGVSLFLQGAIIDFTPGARAPIGLTQAVELKMGQ